MKYLRSQTDLTVIDGYGNVPAQCRSAYAGREHIGASAVDRVSSLVN